MRIGIMLRAFDEKGGIGVYARNITRHLIERGPEHQFILYFTNDHHVNKFDRFPNVTARSVSGPGKIVWDQISMPFRFRRDALDVIFHPKFTVPLLCPGRSVMVLHGAGWFIPETRQFWSRTTLLYTRIMMPIYCRLAGAVLSVSDITRDVFIDRLGVSPEKITTVYFAPGTQFNTRLPPERIEAIREKYRLPRDFILTLSGSDRGDRKNFSNILDAFRNIHSVDPRPLVVAGRGCDQFRSRYDIPDDGFGNHIHFPGWVDQEDLPALYQMATVFLYPSNMEAFPIPITEALVSGIPIVTSNQFGLKELAGDAAALVDPSNPDEITEAVLDLLRNKARREQLRQRALERSKLFDWDRCARQTLHILEAIGQHSDPSRC